MGYYRRYRRFQHPTTTVDRFGNEVDLTDQSLKARIEKTIPLAKTAGDKWAEEFLTSIKDGFDKYGRLTPKQYEILAKIEWRNDPKRKKENASWRRGFTADMRDKMVKVAKYYRARQNGYWKDLVEKILNDKSFVPTQKQYEAFVSNNHYATGVLSAWGSKPKFGVGSTVSPVTRNGKPAFDWSLGFIVDVDHEPPLTHARGGKCYMVLPAGVAAGVLVAERDLKKYRG